MLVSPPKNTNGLSSRMPGRLIVAATAEQLIELSTVAAIVRESAIGSAIRSHALDRHRTAPRPIGCAGRRGQYNGGGASWVLRRTLYVMSRRDAPPLLESFAQRCLSANSFCG